jgi:hypothetical protein
VLLSLCNEGGGDKLDLEPEVGGRKRPMPTMENLVRGWTIVSRSSSNGVLARSERRDSRRSTLRLLVLLLLLFCEVEEEATILFDPEGVLGTLDRATVLVMAVEVDVDLEVAWEDLL